MINFSNISLEFGTIAWLIPFHSCVDGKVAFKRIHVALLFWYTEGHGNGPLINLMSMGGGCLFLSIETFFSYDIKRKHIMLLVYLIDYYCGWILKKLCNVLFRIFNDLAKFHQNQLNVLSVRAMPSSIKIDWTFQR